MTVETAAKTISLILAPVVMLTACGLLVSGMLQQYSAINGRVRAMTAERLSLLGETEAGANNARGRERRIEIDHQVPMLLHRHRLVRDAVLCVYAAVLVFVSSMFVIAAAAEAKSGALATAALVVFLAGTAVLLVGMVFIALDIRTSHESLEYETTRVLGLDRVGGEGDAGPAPGR